MVLATLVLDAALAQEPEKVDVLGRDEPISAPRPVGDVQTWLNILDDDRIPIVEKPLLEGAQRGLIPPRTRRTGFVPRLTVTADYEDNLTFTANNRVDDIVTVISPGISYANAGASWRVNLDYAFESAVYLDNSDFNDELDAQSGLLSGTFSVTPRTQLMLIDIFRQTRDSTEQLIPGAVIGRTRTYSNNLFVNATHSLTPRADVGLQYANTLQIVDDPKSVDVTIHEGLGSLDVGLTSQDRAGINSQFRSFAFSGTGGETATAVTLDYQHEFNERLVARARAGAVHTGADEGHTFLTGSASVDASFKNAKLSLKLERGLTSSAGVSVLLLEDAVTASSLVRLARGLQASAEFSYSNLVTVDEFEQEVDEVNARLALSYALSEHLWLRLKYTFAREAPEDEDHITANKIMFSIVGSS